MNLAELQLLHEETVHGQIAVRLNIHANGIVRILDAAGKPFSEEAYSSATLLHIQSLVERFLSESRIVQTLNDEAVARWAEIRDERREDGDRTPARSAMIEIMEEL